MFSPTPEDRARLYSSDAKPQSRYTNFLSFVPENIPVPRKLPSIFYGTTSRTIKSNSFSGSPNNEMDPIGDFPPKLM